MNNSNVGMLDTIKELKKILSSLDDLGQTIPAIKVEEAILILQQSSNHIDGLENPNAGAEAHAKK